MGESGSGSGALFWAGILLILAVIVGGGWLVFWARRAAKAPDPGPTPGFTLDDLRRMVERGEITRREFDTARDAMVQRAREAARRERDLRGGTDWGGSGEQDRAPRR